MYSAQLKWGALIYPSRFTQLISNQLAVLLGGHPRGG